MSDDQISNNSSAPDGVSPGGGPGQDDDNGGLEDDDTVPINSHAGWLFLVAIIMIGLSSNKKKSSEV